MSRASIGLDVLATLLILFSVFVLGDIVTTVWLIYNDPSGISNEANPFGALLYLKYGVAGLFFGKVLFFFPFSVMILIAESRFQGVGWFHHANEVIVLGLIAYSLVVFLNNTVAIIMLHAMRGWPFMVKLLSVMRLFILIFTLSLEVGVLNLLGFRGWLRRVEAVLGSLLVILPLLMYEPLYRFLSENPLMLVAYLASMLTVLGVSFYLTDEALKERGALLGVSG